MRCDLHLLQYSTCSLFPTRWKTSRAKAKTVRHQARVVMSHPYGARNTPMKASVNNSMNLGPRQVWAGVICHLDGPDLIVPVIKLHLTLLFGDL